MTDVNITDLRARLPEYLDRASRGEEVRVTRRGKVIARLVPATDRRRAAQRELEKLRSEAIIGDVESPLGEPWNLDADT
jgi:prevent-host-death family protein